MKAASFGQAVEAVRKWQVDHGRPPTPQEWEKAEPGRPSRQTIRRRWGWDELMAAALGCGPTNVRRLQLRARQRKFLLPLRRARDELGRWPTGHEWEHATADHAARRTYEREFGGWLAACRAAARLKIEEP